MPEIKCEVFSVCDGSRVTVIPSGFKGCRIAVFEDHTYDVSAAYIEEEQYRKLERNNQTVPESKLHMRHKKVLIIDATNYPLIMVTKPLSTKGALKNDVLYGDEEEGLYYRQFYDYQPEDIEGGEVQWLKDRNERASCLRSLSQTGV